jgi:ParB family chromosome partitioning protein
MARLKLQTRYDVATYDIYGKNRPKDDENDSPPDFAENAENSTSPVTETRYSEDMVKLPLASLVVHTNIRKEIDQEAINELASSIEKNGVLQPIRVFPHNGKYYIIVGQRRFLASKQLDLAKMPCIITTEPSHIDLIYQQAVENEQSESLTSKERENYVYTLYAEHNQSVKNISERLGKSDKWIYQILEAYKTRKKCGDFFKERNIDLSTKDLHLIKNLDEELMEQAAELVVINPNQKTNILKQAVKKSVAKKGTSKKTKPKKEFFTSDSESKNDNNIDTISETSDEFISENPIGVESFLPNDSDTEISTAADDPPIYKQIRMIFTVLVDHDKKEFKVIADNSGEEVNLPLFESLKQNIRVYYKENSYSVS